MIIFLAFYWFKINFVVLNSFFFNGAIYFSPRSFATLQLIILNFLDYQFWLNKLCICPGLFVLMLNEFRFCNWKYVLKLQKFLVIICFSIWNMVNLDIWKHFIGVLLINFLMIYSIINCIWLLHDVCKWRLLLIRSKVCRLKYIDFRWWYWWHMTR